jgi:hypothetical protein
LGCGRGVDRRRLHVLVRRQRVDIGAALEEQACSINAAEEAGQAKWMEAVVAEGIRAGWILVEQLAQAVGFSERRRFENVELTIAGEELLDLFVVPSVQRLQQVGQRRPPLANR